ncbi:hypothetical protein [Niabella drilacis]|uniref:Uncharacterized protein n=1 Tax=Niabella drilacis (strain DSM 25811 / CCM 8410 / CCUG 62505 / LMG 26954 / E90) TaxID=1285928 RepID=A0A1G6U6S5_NIADE|nr:hypothetical protein [Niabella drilacis]SDD37122.1 hypothetical protein SAMN04487894_108169 [Niabella drilacis]
MRITSRHVQLKFLLYITTAMLAPFYCSAQLPTGTTIPDAEKRLIAALEDYSILIRLETARIRRNEYAEGKKKILDRITSSRGKGPEADSLFMRHTSDFQDFLDDKILKKGVTGMRIYIGTRWKENFYRRCPDKQNRWKLVFIFTPTIGKDDQHPSSDYSRKTFYIYTPEGNKPFQAINKQRAGRYVRNFQKPRRTKKRIELNSTIDAYTRALYGNETKHIFFNRNKVCEMTKYIQSLNAPSLKMLLFTYPKAESDSLRSRLGLEFIFANPDGSDYATNADTALVLESIGTALGSLSGETKEKLIPLFMQMQNAGDGQKKRNLLASMIRTLRRNEALTDDEILAFDTGSPTPPPKNTGGESLDPSEPMTP